jgi:hypothetical protein
VIISDLDEVIFCTTLQQLEVSGDKHELLKIKVQVKNQKVNSFFNNGSQCNVVFETLVDELGLETCDLVEVSSLVWLQGKTIMRITRRCKIKFSISVSYVNEVECEFAPLNTCGVMLGIAYL